MIDLGEKKLKKYIKTIGLFNAKAKNVISLSKILVSKFNNKISAILGNEWHGGNLSYHLKSRPKFQHTPEYQLNASFWVNLFGAFAGEGGFILIGPNVQNCEKEPLSFINVETHMIKKNNLTICMKSFE